MAKIELWQIILIGVLLIVGIYLMVTPEMSIFTIVPSNLDIGGHGSVEGGGTEFRIVSGTPFNNCDPDNDWVGCWENSWVSAYAKFQHTTTFDKDKDYYICEIPGNGSKTCLPKPFTVDYICSGNGDMKTTVTLDPSDWPKCGSGGCPGSSISNSGTYIAVERGTKPNFLIQCYSYYNNWWVWSGRWFQAYDSIYFVDNQVPSGIPGEDYEEKILECDSDFYCENKCISDWEYSEWSSCVNAQRSRTKWDDNSCNGLQETTETAGCVCDVGETQTQTCYDESTITTYICNPMDQWVSTGNTCPEELEPEPTIPFEVIIIGLVSIIGIGSWYLTKKRR